MEELIFAVWVYMHHNPHQNEPYLLPLEYGEAAYEHALDYPDVGPEDIVTTMVAEHGGGHPYPADSIEHVRHVDKKTGKPYEKPYAYGLMQLSKKELQNFNTCHHHDSEGTVCPYAWGRYYEVDDLLDPLINIEVGAFSIHRNKTVHATARRCKRKVEVCEWVWNEAFETAEKHCHMRPQRHIWVAHTRCGSKARESCKTSYRQRLIKRFGKFHQIEKIYPGVQAIARAIELARRASAQSGPDPVQMGMKWWLSWPDELLEAGLWGSGEPMSWVDEEPPEAAQ